MRPIHVVTSKCKRCGKAISSSIRSTQESLGEICKDCITQAEQHQILTIQGKEITEKM